MVLFEKPFRRCFARLDNLVRVIEVMGFVPSFSVEKASPLQAIARQSQRVARDIAQRTAADLRVESEFRHRRPHSIPIRRAPILHHIPSGVERLRVVKDSGPKRRKRDDVVLSTHICPAHLEISLQPHLGEDGRDVVCPIGLRRAFTGKLRKLAGQQILERGAGDIVINRSRA